MGALSRQQQLERTAAVAVAVFVAAFAAGTRALQPRAVPLDIAFAGVDAGHFPATAAHVGIAHLVACIAFGATLLQSYTTWMFTVHPLKTQVALLVSLVSGASTVLYGAKFAGAVTILEAATPGTFCMPLRYLQWGFSTGCLICMLGALSPEGPRARAVLRRTLAINAAMMTCACLERLLPAPANLGAFAAGGACFVANLRGQYELFRLAAMTLMLPADRVALAALQRMTTLTWILFPLTRAAALGGVLGRNAEEVAFCVCDFAAKFGYATFLLAGTFSIASKD